jgi:cytochrome P450
VNTAPARSLSLLDNLRFNLRFVLPYVTQGIFTRSRFWLGLWTRIHPDPLGVALLSDLRRKYGTPYLWVRLVATRSLLVLDLDGVRRILDRSPDVYAEPPAKRRGMAHFQPHALTISRGEAWQNRRAFNVAVLGGGRLHPHADRFLEMIRREVDVLRQRPGRQLTWDDLQELFEKISLQIIFGAGARNDRATMALLQRMLRESNRGRNRRRSRHFQPFYARLRSYLDRAEEPSLAASARRAPSDALTRVENQVPHWMFAMNETLAANAARTLAVIAASPPVERRVRQELAQVDLASARDIERLAYLEGCLQEAMRLWPTTPLLAREAVAEDLLGSVRVRPKEQVLIPNGFHHRDRASYPLADTFSPEAWPAAAADYRFNHLSHGPQVCAGIGLTLFIGTAVLAALLSRDRYTLIRPTLDPHRPMPQTLDYFALTFARARLPAAAPPVAEP